MSSVTRRALALAALLILPLSGNVLAADRTLTVGVTAGPHEEIMQEVAKVAARSGLTLKIVSFTDYNTPNAALDAGDLDANSYQHQPFLDQQIRDRNYKIVSIAKTVVFPMGVYSKKFKAIGDIKPGARFGLPNDPTNETRALRLFVASGLIKLKDEGFNTTPRDVTDNPHNITFVELPAPQLVRSLDDVDFAAINTNFALDAGLVPARDALAIEAPKGPYTNVIAVRIKDKDDPRFAALVAAYHSKDVKDFIATKYAKSVVPAW